MVSRRKAYDSRWGFTLVEMAVALAVLALVLLLAAPAIPRRRADADEAAHHVAHAIERARTRAARQAAVVGVEFDVANGHTRLLERTTFHMDSLVTTEPLMIPAGVKLDSNAPGGSFHVWLHPLGVAHGGPFVLRGRALRVVTINPWNGRIRVETP